MNVQKENGVSYELDDKSKTARIIRSPDAQGDLFIPKSIQTESGEYIIIGIEKDSFKRIKNIKSITFAEDSAITYLGDNCFSETSIKQIIIPDSVTKFDESAFSWCNSLTSIVINPGSKLTTIGMHSFSFTPIANLYIPASLETLEKEWQSNIFDLNTISISPENKTFTLVDDKVLLAKSSKSSGTFDVIKFSCKDIVRFKIPSNITIVGYSSFCDCRHIQKVDFSQCQNLTEISGRAFRGCKALKSVRLPSSVIKIGFEAFYDCSSLANVTFGENSQLETIGVNAFYNCFFTSFVIPEKVKSMVSSTFSNCHQLSKITFPKNSNLTSLGENVFLHTNFKSIIIPANIKEIGYCGLGECMNLVFVEFLSDRIKLGTNFFRNSPNVFVVSFPNADVIRIGHTPFISGSENCRIYCKPRIEINI